MPITRHVLASGSRIAGGLNNDTHCQYWIIILFVSGHLFASKWFGINFDQSPLPVGVEVDTNFVTRNCGLQMGGVN